MTIRNVPASPKCPSASDVRSGRPVRASTQWLEMAEAANYLNSHEITLVSAHADVDYIDSARTYSFYLRPRHQIRCLLWVLVIRSNTLWASGDTSILQSDLTIQIGSGTVYPVSVLGEDLVTVYILDEITQTSTAYEEDIVVTKTSGDNIYVNQISCFALRRYGLDIDAGSPEYACDIASCNSGALIQDKDAYSIDGVIDAIANAKTFCKRPAIFNWYAGVTTGIQIGQGTWVNIFHAQPEVLARSITSGVTVTAVNIRFLAAANDISAGSGDAYIRAVADSGDSATATISVSDSLQYYSVNLDIKTEDLSNAKGRQSSTADRITFAVHGAGLSGTDYAIKLYAINVGES